jgi:hypothetical protein
MPGAAGLRDMAAAAEPKILESRSAKIYNPPIKSLRPFAENYPAGAITDDAGRLRSIEGSPLTARYVVGRTQAGGSDVALPREALDEIATAGTGSRIVADSAQLRGRNVGAVRLARYSGEPEKVIVSEKLTPEDFDRVSAHEIGHVIDQLAGEIPSEGLKTQLRRIYNDLNTSPKDFRMVRQERTGIPVPPRYQTTPESFGYSGKDVDREHWAEAIRAYMTDPNYLKTVAPGVAARIRQMVNTNPRLSKIIQFNALLAGAALGAGMMTDEGEAWSPDQSR